MFIGIPKEIKNHEYRVGATPNMVKQLVRDGHRVVVEGGAGAHIGFTDDLYISAGAQIVSGPADVYAADMIIKVKEPQASEFPLLRKGQIIYGYLHLAPDPVQTEALVGAGVVGIAYETVTDNKGGSPLLRPMSEIAGRMAIQVGAYFLQMGGGGRGVLLGGVPGVAPGKVVVIGGGISGTHAARMAVGLGADVTVLDTNIDRLRELDDLFGPALKTLYSSPVHIEEQILQADLVIGAVLVRGKKAPKLVTAAQVSRMKKGAVVVDIAIDQGGCFETSRMTTHTDPIYIVDGVVHYCVGNMPGGCARSATEALTNATSHYARIIARDGWKQALKDDANLCNGLNVCLGSVTSSEVAEDLGYTYKNAREFL